MSELRPVIGVHLTLDKRMPIWSGLGSSAACSVAALIAVNTLPGSRLKKVGTARLDCSALRTTGVKSTGWIVGGLD
jgi:homoserine kinase